MKIPRHICRGLLLLSAGVAALPAQPVAEHRAHVLAMSGDQIATMVLADTGTAMVLIPKLHVPNGATITVGPYTRLHLQTFEGAITTAEPGTTFKLESADVVITPDKKRIERTTLTLRSGNLVANLDPKKREKSRYGVRTPKGTAGARGTNYAVSVEAAAAGADSLTVVTVLDGTVAFGDRGRGPTIALPPGTGSNGDSNAVKLAALYEDSRTAALADRGMQATAGSVAVLMDSERSGVNTGTLNRVFTSAAVGTGDVAVIDRMASAAVAANPSASDRVADARNAALAAIPPPPPAPVPPPVVEPEEPPPPARLRHRRPGRN
ncbi:FecR domain-containing protein [Synoicihabitans lomoniglobus]|uniref:FecR domain-containing protein n=1 Tax=Synoicihabitans lomoniglobus TaxID=2909285 RepID=A0AAE9ZYM4_9BACT|nr:FecR family protein [Opitutaceae bacterium LMO-M01]WED63628.1 FecR domain-containing protein [Opitutaceae bacterium LMO-M01]